ncbi:MAG: ABC transporter ATP-binding protein [Planctomycetota bacterium]
MIQSATTGLSIRDLEFGYSRARILLEIEAMHVPPGEVHCIIGPSGAGKSTLLRLIAGLQPPTRGEIKIDGQIVVRDRRTVPPERRRVGFVFQDCQLFPHLSAKRNIAFGLSRVSRQERNEAVNQLITRMGLTDRADARPHQLSGGEQQRVAVARALACRPSIMLMDEPFRSLDPATAATTRELVMNEVRAAGTPTIIVTHDHDEAIEIGDHVWSLDRVLNEIGGAGDSSATSVLQPVSGRSSFPV